MGYLSVVCGTNKTYYGKFRVMVKDGQKGEPWGASGGTCVGRQGRDGIKGDSCM